MKIKELPKKFIGKGEVKDFLFSQILANESAYLYEVVTTGGSVHFEVFTRKLNTYYGNIKYPRAKSFGRWAFVCYTPEKARLRFRMMSDMGSLPKVAPIPCVELKKKELAVPR